MLDLIEKFPDQIKEAVLLVDKIMVKGVVNHIIVCGMGGSAIPGDFLRDYLRDEINVPIIVNRDYNLPKFVNEKSLIFVVSYSGNTEETLSAYNEAKKRGAKIVCITSGGKLGKLCKESILIPAGIPPRLALAYLFFPILMVLQSSGLIRKQHKSIEETINLLEKFDDKEAQRLARKLYKRIPVVYASEKYRSIAYRWQTQFNEDSKILAHHNVFSEMNHNEIEAYSDLIEDNVVVIMIRDKEDLAKIKKRMNLTADIIKKHVGVTNIDLKGKCFLAKMFYAIHFGDYFSYYLAKLNNVDMIRTDKIEDLKKRLR